MVESLLLGCQGISAPAIVKHHSLRGCLDSGTMNMAAPPPIYTETTAQIDNKADAPKSHSHSPWVVQRTSVTVESTPLYDDHRSDVVSMTSSTRSNEKRAIRKVLTRLGKGQCAESKEEEKSIYDGDSFIFGTQVLIEGGNPKRYRLEMKGLEQAASMKRWEGDGKPAEAWGKLMKVRGSGFEMRQSLIWKGPRVVGS